MNASLKAASHCFIDKSLSKCLSVEMSRRQRQCKQCLSYDGIDLCHATEIKEKLK